MPEHDAGQLAFSFGGSHDQVVSVSKIHEEEIEILLQQLHDAMKDKQGLFAMALRAKKEHGSNHHEDVIYWLAKYDELNGQTKDLRKCLRVFGHRLTADENDERGLSDQVNDLRQNQDELPLVSVA